MKPSTKYLFFILLGLVIVIRIWIISQAPSSFGFELGDVSADQGVIVLMAKHILDGGEIPIFHYGQPYLGSLEAFLLSICYLLFGFNLWVMHIVPLVCYTVFSFSLFLLTRYLFGAKAGFWSLLWCAFAPLSLTEYSLMPQLGNITAPMFGTILIYLTLISLKSADRFTKRWGYGLLGLLAGVGWWTSPMLIYYLFTIPLFILLREKKGEILKGGSRGVFLFFVGALPFFCYYVLDSQVTVLGMGEGYSLKNLKEGLPLFFLDRIHYFLDLDKFASLNRVGFWLGAITYLGATIIVYWSHRRDLINLFKPGRWLKISPGFILVMFSSIFLITLSSSVHIGRNASRYFFPLATFFPVALGCLVVSFRHRAGLVPISLCLILFFFQIGAGWKTIKAEAPLAEAATKGYIRLANDLVERKIPHVYSWPIPGSDLINFYSRERVISSRTMLERYRPYEDILEGSDQEAFLDPGDRAILPSLKVIGGSCQQEKIDSYNLYYGFEPPRREYREISREELKITTSDQTDMVSKMVDRRWDTEWSSLRPKNPDMWVKIDLGKIRSLGMLRLYNQGSQHAQYAYNMAIEASSDGISWKTIFPETNADLYYWDGPHLFFWELNYRWECRFGPLQARYLLIKNKEQTERYPWNIGELYVFEDQGRQTMDYSHYKTLLKTIERSDLQRVYAGRWLSAKIKEATRGGIKTVQTFTHASFDRWPRSRVVAFDPKTGFIVDQQDQAGFETLFKEEGIKPVCESIGRWRLYYFKDWGAAQKPLESHRGFWWTGFGVLKVGPSIWEEYHRRGLDVRS